MDDVKERPARPIDLGTAWAIECDACPHGVVIHQREGKWLNYVTEEKAERAARLHNEFAHRPLS